MVLKSLAILAVLIILAMGMPAQQPRPFYSVGFLQAVYAAYNEAYFCNTLPKEVVLDFSLHNSDRIAQTTHLQMFGPFRISFNKDFAKAERVQELFLLHEMCHIKTWKQGENNNDHGSDWQACMVTVDAADGFRDILIENYGRK